MSTVTAPPPFRRYIARVALMAAIWFGLNGTDWSSWLIGVPAVLAASTLSVALLPPVSWHWSPRGTVWFAGFFLRESLRGGWEVARYALSPGETVRPEVIWYRFTLPAGPARLFFCSAVSLLPGTSIIIINEQRACVHVLNSSPHTDQELRRIERRVAALFALKETEAPA
jgi:multicomponent Na+:H+ antiporter subunit E